MASVPVARYTKPGDDTRGSNNVPVNFNNPKSAYLRPPKNRPGPVPVNRFFQIGITNNTYESCFDPRDAKSAVSGGVTNGGYRFNVAQKAQVMSYQNAMNTRGYAPGQAIVTGNTIG